MEVIKNEQNDDEMILVVIGDDDGTDKYETSESPEPEMHVPISAKIIPREHLYSIEDNVEEICKLEEFIEVKPDIEALDEEYLSQENEEFSQGGDGTKSDVTQKKYALSKNNLEYLIDKDILSPNNRKKKPNVVSPKNKKTKNPQKLKSKPKHTQKKVQNVQIKKEPTSISDDDDYFEIEFLEDDVLVTPKNGLEENFTEPEFLDNPPKTIRQETISPNKHFVKKEEEYILEEDQPEDYVEDFTEIEFLDNPPKKKKSKTKASPKRHLMKDVKYISEEEDYIPEEEEEDDEIDEDLIEDDYVPPRGRKRKRRNPPRRPTKTTVGQTAPKHTKTVERPINSFIAELKRNQPIYKQDKEKLVEYLVDYMRRRRPPSPPPNYCYLSDVNRYNCAYCDIVKPTEPAASRHYQAAHGPRYLVCLACGNGFRSTVILYKHEKRCSAPDANIQLRARGVFLGRKGRGRPYLTKNKFIPKEPPPGQPPRRIHIPHRDKIKYYCEQCPAYFTREYLLEEHMHKHTGFRAFQCPDCPAAYVSRYQLNKHSKKHSNCEYICDHCGKVFKLKTTLTSHLDTHLPRPRFGCGRCGRRYAKRDAVRLHIMRDHMNLPPPAVCPMCPKRFNRMCHVKLHMKKDHGLTLMTKRSIDRDLPYMKIEDLEGAKIVFKKDDGVEIVDINTTLNEQILP